MSDIHIDKSYWETEEVIHISNEGALYIAQVMQEEFVRTGDQGARRISEAINEQIGGSNE